MAYSVFCGSQYEEFTMTPVVDDFVKRFNLIDYVVVAESGLMTGKNLTLLQRGNYKYILGARIRNDFERGQGIRNRSNDIDSHD